MAKRAASIYAWVASMPGLRSTCGPVCEDRRHDAFNAVHFCLAALLAFALACGLFLGFPIGGIFAGMFGATMPLAAWRSARTQRSSATRNDKISMTKFR